MHIKSHVTYFPERNGEEVLQEFRGAGEWLFCMGEERIMEDFLPMADKSQSQFINLPEDMC